MTEPHIKMVSLFDTTKEQILDHIGELSAVQALARPGEAKASLCKKVKSGLTRDDDKKIHISASMDANMDSPISGSWPSVS